MEVTIMAMSRWTPMRQVRALFLSSPALLLCLPIGAGLGPSARPPSLQPPQPRVVISPDPGRDPTSVRIEVTNRTDRPIYVGVRKSDNTVSFLLTGPDGGPCRARKYGRVVSSATSPPRLEPGGRRAGVLTARMDYTIPPGTYRVRVLVHYRTPEPVVVGTAQSNWITMTVPEDFDPDSVRPRLFYHLKAGKR